LTGKPETGEPGENRGVVQIQVGSPARTLQPDLAGFSRYELDFAGPEGASHGKETINSGTSATVELSPGTWTITAAAYTGTGDGAVKAATGSAEVTVSEGKTTPAAITLVPYTEGAGGTLAYTLEYPTGLKSANLIIAKADGTALSDGTIDLLGDAKKTGTRALAAGAYRIQVRLVQGDLIAGKTESLHIYPTLTTALNYTFTAEDFVAFAEVKDVTVNGTAQLDNGGVAVNAEVGITLYNETFTGILTTDDLSSWITNLPAGLSVKAKAAVAEGGQSITLVITGTPTEASSAELAITIPGDALQSEKALTVRTNPEAKFAIGLPAASAAVEDVSLAGEADKSFSGNVVINLTNETFNVLSADADLSGWFKGLPGGLAAKASSAVAAEAKTLTIAITGTPTAVAAAAKLAITIPGTALSRGEALTVTDNSKATITINENSMAGVHLVGKSSSGGTYWKYTKTGVLVNTVAEIPIIEEEDFSSFKAIVLDGDDVHFGGFYIDEAENGIFIYQKNDGPRLESESIPSAFTEPFRIAVDGNDAYMMGVDWDYPYIWKILSGGTVISSATKITDIQYPDTPYDMVVVGPYLYIGGFSSGVAKCWKIPAGTLDSVTEIDLGGEGQHQAHAMAVSGNTIYLGGSQTINSVAYGVYWILDTQTDLIQKIAVETSGTESRVYGIAVSGDQVYLAGTKKGSDNKDKLALWKGAAGSTPDRTVMMDDGSSYAATQIALDGADVYVAGMVNTGTSTFGYWKIPGGTGTPQWVPVQGASSQSGIQGIAVR
jgi:hypothetical protein